MTVKPLTAERLREVLHYDPETGEFRNRKSRGRAKVGALAGSDMVLGYRLICIDYQDHLAHRLAWLYCTGEWPSSEIDHKDGDRGNNRFGNLRPATHAENCQNAPKRKNVTGFHGVYRRDTRFVARIYVSGKKHHLGLFETAKEAHAAYINAKRTLHTFQPTFRD